MRPSAISLLLISGAAFFSGLGLARVPSTVLSTSQAVTPNGSQGQARQDSGISSKREQDNHLSGKPDAAWDDFPAVPDPQVLAALQNPDLISAVRAIMARQNEDQSADTRLIQLIEFLPQSRLGEIPGLLGATLQNETITRSVLTTWAEREPESALAWATGRPSTDATALSAVLTGWARRDPAAATAWLLARPANSLTGALQNSLLQTLAESDPAKALEIAQAQEWILTKPDSTLAILRNWGSRDPTAALMAVRRLSLPGSGTAPVTLPADLLDAVLEGASKRDPEDMAALVAQLPPQEVVKSAPSIARNYLLPHPEAMQRLLANPEPGVPEKALLLALVQFGAGEVVDQLSGFHEAEFRQKLLTAAIGGPASSNWGTVELGHHLAGSSRAQEAVLLALSEGPPEQCGRLIPRLLSLIPQENPGFAAKLWEQLDPAGQQASIHSFLHKLGQQAPDAAREIWEASPPDVQAKSLRGLMAGLSWQKPQEAIALALQQLDPALRINAFTVAMAHWAERDPGAALPEFERLAPRLDLPAMARFLPAALAIDGKQYYFRNTILKERLKFLTEQSPP